MSYSLLLVDDNDTFRAMLSAMLSERGYSITEAGSADEASDLLAENRFHAVLCDYMMPEKNGVEFTAEAKVKYPTLPIIIITGYASEQNLQECLAAGAEDYIPKPVNRETLEDVVCRACYKNRRLDFLFDNEKGDKSGLDNALDESW